MQRVTTALRFLARIWAYGFAGKLGIILGAAFLLMLCSAPFQGASRPRVATPTAAPVAQMEVTEPPAPTDAPRPTRGQLPTWTPKPTETLVPTFTPVPTPTRDPALKAQGVPPLDKNNCPDNYPIKGNIGNNGKIYHIGDPSYKQTNPEICFAYIADAVAAGFRAP